MNRWSNIKLIWHKEIRSLLRDKKALLTIFLPIIIYPVIMMFFFGVTSIVENNLGEEIRRVAISGDVSTEIIQAITKEEKLEIVQLNQYPEERAIENESVDVILKQEMIEGLSQYLILYNSTIEASNRGQQMVRRLMTDHRQALIESSVNALDLSVSVLELVAVENIEVTEESASSRVLASVLGLVAPFILIMYSIIGIYSITSDLSAGEKERFTLETILSVPIPKSDIMMGKLFAGVTVGLLSGLSNIISMFPIAYAIAAMIPDLSMPFSPLLPVFVLLMLLPVMFFTCAFMLCFGFFAKTYQEAQTYGAFVMMALMLPGYIGMIPDIELTKGMACLPITNAMLVMREAFVGDYLWPEIGISLGINGGLAFIAIMGMSKVFISERVIFGTSKGLSFKGLLRKGGRHE